MRYLKRNYVTFVLGLTGAVALAGGALVAWPALCHVASRMVGAA